MKILNVSSSPHLRHRDTTRGIMLDVLIALSPAAIYGCILFGIKALLLIVTCVVTSVASEYLWEKALKKPITIGDLSATVTGLLLGMSLPTSVAIWQAAIGAVVAIIVVKQMFGGIGCNFVNPAIAARIVLLVSFPAAMSRFTVPLSDAVSSATPLADNVNTYTFNDMFFGMRSGSIGETSAFLLLIGAVYLMVRRVITPVIPVTFIGTVAVFSALFGENMLISLFGGGLIMVACFMATDYTTTPTTLLGKAVFGVGCGIITFVIRRFGALPEGISYAILIMNILVPHINKLTLSKPFGYQKPKKEGTLNG